jgi:Flp pilus assembly protein TadD
MIPSRLLAALIGLACLLQGCDQMFESAVAHQQLAVQLYQQEKYDGAVAESRAALRIDPDDPDTEHLLGVALIDQGNVSVAAKQLKAFLKPAPSTSSTAYDIEDAKRRLTKLDGT